MQQVFYDMLGVIHEYGSGIGGFSVGIVLLCMLILIYQNDMEKSSMVAGLLMALLLVLYPFHAYYIYSVYGTEVYMHVLALVPVIITAAYTIFRTAERYEGRNRMIALVIGILLFILACSFDDLSLKEFRFYNEPPAKEMSTGAVIEE